LTVCIKAKINRKIYYTPCPKISDVSPVTTRQLSIQHTALTYFTFN